VLRLQLLVEMADVEVEVLLTVEHQHTLDRLQGHALRRGAPPAVVKESVVTVLFVAPAPASHLSTTEAENLSGLPLGNLLGNGM